MAKQLDLPKMSQDNLHEFHFDTMFAIADITRTIAALRRDMSKLMKQADEIELEFEARQSQALGQENKLS